ncbi:MAG: hypothetical protein ACOYJ8_02800 [Patescibacteria group bacterium]|jgi:hypothetical protein
MTNLNRRLGIYSSQKRNRLKRAIMGLLVFSLVVLISLIGRQAFFLFKDKTNQAATPITENPLKTITRIAQESSLPIKKIEEKPDMIILLLEPDLEVSLDKKKPISNQLSALQLIINQDKINGRKAKKIDLRFNNPIVVY